MDRVSRPVLARAGEQKILTEKAMETALSLAGLRPDAAGRRRFAVLAMRFAAVLSIAAGVVFLVAFNWQNLGLYARFAMVEAPLLAALLFAWVKGTEQMPGKLSVMLAVLLTGALLALFGQTYQTGANLYELFFGWAALSLPWVVACRYTPCWALWLLLVNTAVALYAGTMGPRAFFHLDQLRWTPWSLPFLVNVVIYVALVALSGARWLQRAVMAAAMTFGTIVMLFRIFDDRSEVSPIEPVLILAASIGFAAYTYSRKEDLFNFAVLALSWIAVTTALIGRAMLDNREGPEQLLAIAIYVIAASTGAVKGIAVIGRSWKTGEAAR